MENANKLNALEELEELEETQEIVIDGSDEYADGITVQFDSDDDSDRFAAKTVNLKPRSSVLVQRIVQVACCLVIAACVVVNVVMLGDNESEVYPPPEPPPPPPILSIDLSDEDTLLAELDSLFVTEPVWTEYGEYSIERNEHLIGWIRLGNTIVDYPVVQKTWEQYQESGYLGFYYLYRNFDGVFRAGSRGTLFVDRHTPISDGRRPDNTVIYGHNMRAGVKFAYLVNYYENFYYVYRKDPTIQFVTIYDEIEDVRNTYKIFAGILVNTEGRHGMVFDYFRRRTFDDNGRWGNSRDEFYDFMGNVLDRSTFYTGVDVQYGDEIMTLSTCIFPLGDAVDTRYAVFARRLRPGEDPIVDVDAAWRNPSPLYFDAWYNVRGGSWGGRTWDTSLVPGFDEWLTGNPDWCSTRPVQPPNLP
jgi:sortase B